MSMLIECLDRKTKIAESPFLANSIRTAHFVSYLNFIWLALCLADFWSSFGLLGFLRPGWLFLPFVSDVQCALYSGLVIIKLWECEMIEIDAIDQKMFIFFFLCNGSEIACHTSYQCITLVNQPDGRANQHCSSSEFRKFPWISIQCRCAYRWPLDKLSQMEAMRSVLMY